MTSASQETLVLKASRGDPAALEQLLTDNLPRLDSYVRRKVGPALRAKVSCSDLVQSVCREVLEELPAFEYRGESAFRYWLVKRAYHKIVDRARFLSAGARGAEAPPEDRLDLYGVTALTPSREAAGREELERVEAAFAELPADYREAIFLHRIVGLQHAEIGEEMGRSEGAVRNLLYRGLARLSMLIRGKA